MVATRRSQTENKEICSSDEKLESGHFSGDDSEADILEKSHGGIKSQNGKSQFSNTIEGSKNPNRKSQPTKKVKKVTKISKGTANSRRSRRINTRATSKEDGSHEKLNSGLKVPVRRPVPRPKKLSKDETVVEVKLLTGTLFLYRGSHPRAEFVRVV